MYIKYTSNTIKGVGMNSSDDSIVLTKNFNSKKITQETLRSEKVLIIIGKHRYISDHKEKLHNYSELNLILISAKKRTISHLA